MQEETQTQTTPVSTPVQSQSMLLKDLLIPISIVVAGIIVGAGLYLGGVATGGSAPVAVVPEKEVDNTSKINPVTATEHIKGNPNALIKIVEFSDYDCPFCSRHHEVMNAIAKKYSGDDVAWVYRHFPLEQLHPNAPAVALASECVAELGGNDAFWKFTDAYFAARGSGDKTAHEELIPKLVTGAGVGQQAFTDCFESGRNAAAVQEDIDDAVETGGRGTPWSIIIGPTGKTYPVNGALPQQAIEQLIEVARQEA